ncbi:hypothetical protein ACFE04_016546 [Oxalis oulophora]
MALSFTRFPYYWSWKGTSGGTDDNRTSSKEKEPVSNGYSVNSSTEWGFGLNSSSDTVKLSTKFASTPRKVKKKWQSREQRRIDHEYDVVLVPSDGVCLSESESDDSDWSIGWLEPHGPDFDSDAESDNSYAVLVPCYTPGCKEVSNNQLLSAINNFPNKFSPGKGFSLRV